MKANINGISIDTADDRLVESHDGMSHNGHSASREVRETADGIQYTVVTTHPDGLVRVEVEADGIRWTRWPNGSVDGVRLLDGAPVECESKAAALGRIGGRSKSEAKAAAARENGAKGGRPTTEFHVGKMFRSEGGWRVCGGVWNGGPIIDQSPWFATREEAEREAGEIHRRNVERDALAILSGEAPAELYSEEARRRAKEMEQEAAK